MIKEELQSENELLKRENAQLRFELAELKRLLFGAKQERHISQTAPEQMVMPFGSSAPVAEVEPTTEQITYSRKKQSHPGRHPLPDHLPVNEIIVEPKEDTTGLKQIGQDVVDTLDYVPGSLRINRYIFPKFEGSDQQGVLQGKMPLRPIEKGIAEGGLLAHLITQKFVYHFPFYRSVKQLKELYDVSIARSTVNDWFVQVCNLLTPLYDCLKQQVLSSDYIQADESPIKVLDKEKAGSTHQGYQWVYHAPQSGLVLFDYRKGRGNHGPKELLIHFKGDLQTDGYSVYDKITKNRKEVNLVGCIAHARRYFFKAKDSDAQRADKALDYFKRLYQIERAISNEGLSPPDIKELRLKESRPVLEQLQNWAAQEKAKVVPKSPIGKAFTYLSLQWPKLIKYVEDGKLLIDNNLIENTIRPLALGRKNYLFAGSHSAAQRIAMMYSFFGTCKRLEVNPYLWLRKVLEQIPQHPINQIDQLLPGKWVETD